MKIIKFTYLQIIFLQAIKKTPQSPDKITIFKQNFH